MQNVHTYKRKIDYKDIDMMGHIQNGVYHDYADEARINLVEENGVKFSDVEKNFGYFPVVNFKIDYKNRIQYSEREVTVELKVTRLKRTNLIFYYEFKKSDGLITATAETLIGFVDKDFNPTLMPDVLYEIFEKYLDKK